MNYQFGITFEQWNENGLGLAIDNTQIMQQENVTTTAQCIADGIPIPQQYECDITKTCLAKTNIVLTNDDYACPVTSHSLLCLTNGSQGAGNCPDFI